MTPTQHAQEAEHLLEKGKGLVIGSPAQQAAFQAATAHAVLSLRQGKTPTRKEAEK